MIAAKRLEMPKIARAFQDAWRLKTSADTFLIVDRLRVSSLHHIPFAGEGDLTKPEQRQIWLDFVGVVDSQSQTVRLRGNDGGIVEFAPDDVQISDSMISVRLDADARLVESRSSESQTWGIIPPTANRSAISRNGQTTTIGLVLFSCHPFKPIGICFDLADEHSVAAC